MIYFFDNYDELDSEKLLKYLSTERLRKYERLKQKRDKENCLAAYILLLGALRKKGVDSFSLEENENGKPFISGRKDIFFNISHCRNAVVLAVDSRPAGIDIQDIKEPKESVIKRVCTDEEQEMLSLMPDKAEAFTRLWTLKESIIKCEGKTIADVKKFSFDFTQKNFQKYGLNFSALTKKNLLISVCGSRDFLNIIEIKNLEDWL